MPTTPKAQHPSYEKPADAIDETVGYSLPANDPPADGGTTAFESDTDDDAFGVHFGKSRS